MKNREVSSKPPIAGDLETMAHQALQSSPYRDIRRVHCEVREGVLTLQGQVSSFYHKQIAQEHLQSKFAGCALDNRLVVSDD
ncbi:BON domain-containing protein [Anatilimnocola floriformis]|uniref:BON domain-containing protein n=1 Tax=Anatilimnocola floriformis TaxID=2948575 RepID=UPI0020C27E85|nr:BON domain-containing protein [Anatilimnocola floriformis]